MSLKTATHESGTSRVLLNQILISSEACSDCTTVIDDGLVGTLCPIFKCLVHKETFLFAWVRKWSRTKILASL